MKALQAPKIHGPLAGETHAPPPARKLRFFLFFVPFVIVFVPYAAFFLFIGTSLFIYSLADMVRTFVFVPIVFFPLGLFFALGINVVEWNGVGGLLLLTVSVWLSYIGIACWGVWTTKRKVFIFLYALFLLVFIANLAGCAHLWMQPGMDPI